MHSHRLGGRLPPEKQADLFRTADLKKMADLFRSITVEKTAEIFRQLFVTRSGDGPDVMIGSGRAAVVNALKAENTTI